MQLAFQSRSLHMVTNLPVRVFRVDLRSVEKSHLTVLVTHEVVSLARGALDLDGVVLVIDDAPHLATAGIVRQGELVAGVREAHVALASVALDEVLRSAIIATLEAPDLTTTAEAIDGHQLAVSMADDATALITVLVRHADDNVRVEQPGLLVLRMLDVFFDNYDFLNKFFVSVHFSI